MKSIEELKFIATVEMDLTVEELEGLSALSTRTGMSVSEMARKCLREGMTKHLDNGTN